MSEMREDLPLVEAPQRWAHSVCDTTPIDYSEIEADKSYATQFIGDYVTNLENVVESYRLQFGFQEGRDVAVVSLRDDVMNVSAPCSVPSANLLYHAALFGEADSTGGEGIWQVEGCALGAEGNELGFELACLSTSEVESPFQYGFIPSGIVPGYELLFGNGSGDCSDGGCIWSQDTRLTQKVELVPGNYRFSWYGQPAEGAGHPLSRDLGGVWNEQGEEIVTRDTVVTFPMNPGSTWNRYSLQFELDQLTTVLVGFSRPEVDDLPSTEAADWDGVWAATVGAPMLDVVTLPNNIDSARPRSFSNTGATLTEVRRGCEDSDGDEFRTRWTRSCETVCPAGTGVNCPNAALEQCYREASFFISQRGLESGVGFIQSGFARGNFNYRISDIALNFVGTGLRNCDNSDRPTSCHSGGFVPYSLYHKGPYFVRNHYGEDFQSYLFEGVIEHARGLAAERYLSNPIGSEDKEMLADFTRMEYQGRPMDGQFVVRIWEDPGVDFSALEDVQIIMNYQYWSR